MRLLLVEDDADLRSALAEFLATGGHEVIEAADGRAALSELEDGRQFGAVLLDVELPGLSGYSVLDAMRASPALRRMPVIVSTGHSLQSSVLQPPVVGVLEKPFDVLMLLEVLRALSTEGTPGAAPS